MSTTPETPALPGDLTYAAMKLAALTLGLRVSGSPDPTDLARRVLRLGIAAAGVAPAPDNGRCGGCRDLGPHRNVPGCDYYEPEPALLAPSPDREKLIAEAFPFDGSDADTVVECRRRVSQLLDALAVLPVASVMPSESNWLLLLMPDSGAHRTREWRGRAVDADAAIERAMDENPGWSVHTLGPDVNAKPAPVTPSACSNPECPLARAHSGPCAPSGWAPDREKLVAEAREFVQSWDLRGSWTPDSPVGMVHRLAEALAVPPVVNEAKLAEVIRSVPRRMEETHSRLLSRGPNAEEIAAVLVERQREWLGNAN